MDISEGYTKVDDNPIFHSSVEAFEEDELNESLGLLLEHNSRVLAAHEVLSFNLADGFTRDLFEICDVLMVSIEVKVYAALVLNKFIAAIKEKTTRMYREQNNFSPEEVHELMREIIMKDLRLRMVSVVQIASKMHFLSFTPRMDEIVSHIKQRSIDINPVTPEELVESEVVVLKAIEFDVLMSKSPVAYLEAVFQFFILKHAEDYLIDVKSYWKAVLQLLEITFISYGEPFKFAIKLCKKSKPKCSPFLDRPSMSHLQMDYLLLVCGILCIPAWRLHGKHEATRIARSLSSSFYLDYEHVLAMASGIIVFMTVDQKVHATTHKLLAKFDELLFSMRTDSVKRRRIVRKRPANDF